MKKIGLIDSNSILYRSFYAIKNLSYEGQAVNAIYGFIKTIIKFVKTIKPDYIIFAFDKGKITFRNKLSKDYKINRKPMPDSLVSQIPIAKKFIKSINTNYIEKENYEADDCIASVVYNFKENKNFIFYIFSNDSDLYPLINDNVFIVIPKDFKIIDKNYIKEKYSLSAKQLIEYKILKGDSSDNIKGVKNIGHKTAINLLKTYGDIENIYKNLDKIKPDRIKEALNESKELIELNRSLINLKQDLNLEINLHLFKYDLLNKEFENFLDNYNFQSIKKDLKDLNLKNTQQNLLF